MNKLLEFPIDKVFPALDLFRIYLCHSSSAVCFNGSDAGAKYTSLLMSFLDNPKAPKAVTMLALRCFSNLSKSLAGANTFYNRRKDIMDRARKHLTHQDKNTRQSAVTLFLNYSCVLLNKPDDLPGR